MIEIFLKYSGVRLGPNFVRFMWAFPEFSEDLKSNVYLCWKKFKSKFSSSRIPSLEDPVLCSMSEYICILFSLSFSEKTLKFEDTENEGNLIGGPLTSITGKLVSLPELILYLNGLSVVVEGLQEANLK